MNFHQYAPFLLTLGLPAVKCDFNNNNNNNNNNNETARKSETTDPLHA